VYQTFHICYLCPPVPTTNQKWGHVTLCAPWCRRLWSDARAATSERPSEEEGAQRTDTQSVRTRATLLLSTLTRLTTAEWSKFSDSDTSRQRRFLAKPSSHPLSSLPIPFLSQVQSSPVRYALKHKVLKGYWPAGRCGFLGHTETVFFRRGGQTQMHKEVIPDDRRCRPPGDLRCIDLWYDCDAAYRYE